MTTYDAGFVGPVVIGNYVWLDSNADGLQDAGESGVAGVRVSLINSTDAVLGSVLTNATGYYQFNQRALPAMRANTPYTVRINRAAQTGGVLDTLQLTQPNAGANDSIDSDGANNGQKEEQQLISFSFFFSLLCLLVGLTLYDAPATTGALNSADLTYDFGFVSALRVGGSVWRDLDADGSQNEAAANPLAGVIVELRDASGTVLATTATQADGSYEFSSVNVRSIVPGTAYTVALPREQPLLDALHETATDAAADDATDSDGARSGDDVLVAVMTGAYGAAPIDNDFGFVAQVKIGDYVWFDTNEDGIQDPGEPGIEGVVVRLEGASATVEATTDATGYYEFESKHDGLLPNSAYTVHVDALQQPLLFMRFGVTKVLTTTQSFFFFLYNSLTVILIIL